MVTYLPSTAQTTITVAELEYPTSLTISAPETVAKDTPFTVSGKLTFREGGVDYPLQGRTIALSYNGVSLGTVTTGTDGTYSKSVMIPEVGTFTIKAEYAGESGLSPSRAMKTLSVTISPMVSNLIPLALGVGLIVFGLKR